MALGSEYRGSGKTRFYLWAPFQKQVTVHIVFPEEQQLNMKQDKKEGYWLLDAQEIYPGYHYYYQLDSREEYPDPASHFQPHGVHGPSQVIDHSFSWNDGIWQGIPLREMVIYELHAGTFTPQGNFEAIIARLDELLNLGINVLELMPVAQFPGKRNWGYDGVFPFAVQNSYGSAHSLKKLVNACHQRGMSILLDVVYNHLGPEGNYLPQFGPYFTEKYYSNWGKGINFDGAFSDEVRHYFIQNALHWLEHYHFDGLRLDAIHGIFDMRAKHFLAELASAVRKFSQKKNKKVYLIAESDLNDTKIIKSRNQGGYELDTQWTDDLHHALHALLTQERKGYYRDFGQVNDLVKAIKEGFVYSGQYSGFRKKSHGNSSRFMPTEKFIVYAQNHDQVGNRMLGERLTGLISWEALKLAAATVLLSPYIPLIFMGEEYGEESPFLYFIDHGDPELIQSVRNGRSKEFAAFQWQGNPPDPEEEETFMRSKLDWLKRQQGYHAVLQNFYRELLKLRRQNPLLRCPSRKQIQAWGSEESRVVIQQRSGKDSLFQFLFLSNFHCRNSQCELKQVRDTCSVRPWHRVFDSRQEEWLGSGTVAPDRFCEEEAIALKPYQFILYRQKGVKNKNGKE